MADRRAGLRLALEVWGQDYQQLVGTARAAAEFGFDALYYGESPHGLNLETWTVLAAVAEAAAPLRIGPVIVAPLPAYRSLALFARQAHALQVTSGRRLDLRLGTGAASAWARPWWEPPGVAYPDRQTRRRILEDWLGALHHLWSRPGEPFAAGHVRFDRLDVTPPVERPPITVAASGPESMLIAARHADVWEASYLTPAEFRALAERFGDLAGDRRGMILRSLEVDAVTATTDAARRRLTDRFLHERGAAGAAALRKALSGTPEDVAEQMAAYRAAGVDQLLIAAVDPHDHSTLEALAEAADLAS
jgi:alkanesulfonate monooxygenase SsuD/methylene tetrahydromethanopterin reductase-like flavin-dependent oxidoreductase (luciferase family)